MLNNVHCLKSALYALGSLPFVMWLTVTIRTVDVYIFTLKGNKSCHYDSLKQIHSPKRRVSSYVIYCRQWITCNITLFNRMMEIRRTQLYWNILYLLYSFIQATGFDLIKGSLLGHRSIYKSQMVYTYLPGSTRYPTKQPFKLQPPVRCVPVTDFDDINQFNTTKYLVSYLPS
jgi:hypothetical protein